MVRRAKVKGTNRMTNKYFEDDPSLENSYIKEKKEEEQSSVDPYRDPLPDNIDDLIKELNTQISLIKSGESPFINLAIQVSSKDPVMHRFLMFKENKQVKDLHKFLILCNQDFNTRVSIEFHKLVVPYYPAAKEWTIASE